MADESPGVILLEAGRTDAAGHFRLNPYTGKVFTISVYPPDGKPYLSYEKRVALADAQQPPKIDVALPRGLLLHGRITEKSSAPPVAGALVKYQNNPRFLTGPIACPRIRFQRKSAASAEPTGPIKLASRRESGQ